MNRRRSGRARAWRAGYCGAQQRSAGEDGSVEADRPTTRGSGRRRRAARPATGDRAASSLGAAAARSHDPQRALLTRLILLSLAAALATIALKTVAWRMTGSVGLFSDAIESVVNFVAAAGALVAIRWATRPPDKEHMYGHEKAEYFAAAAEGLMIVGAAASIAWVAVDRLVHPAGRRLAATPTRGSGSIRERRPRLQPHLVERRRRPSEPHVPRPAGSGERHALLASAGAPREGGRE